MRAATVLVLAATALLAWACASTNLNQPLAPAGEQTSANDCAVIAAIAKEHYKFGPDNPPPPLKDAGDSKWRPDCDFDGQGFEFTEYDEASPASDPRERLKWVAFQKPEYSGNGALVRTEIMHGPLAGMGYECRVLSGFAGWTVGECKVSWVS
jgi:hypothetical protein